MVFIAPATPHPQIVELPALRSVGWVSPSFEIKAWRCKEFERTTVERTCHPQNPMVSALPTVLRSDGAGAGGSWIFAYPGTIIQKGLVQ